MPGSGAEAERLKPGWPRRLPRRPPSLPTPPRLLGMGKQTFYLITALPPPRPPPRSPLPAQPLAPQTQCTAAASPTLATLREHPPPTHWVWGTLHCPVSPLPTAPCWPEGPLCSPSGQQGAVGRGETGSPLGDQRWHKLLQPRGCIDGEMLVQRLWGEQCLQSVPIQTGEDTEGRQTPISWHCTPHLLPPHPGLPHVPSRARGAGSPFSSFAPVLIGRKGCSPIKTRLSAADGYLERAAPIPGRRRARRIGRFGCIFLDRWPSALSCKAACFSFSVGLTPN